MKIANKENFKERFYFVCHFYIKDLKQQQLKMQLDVMASSISKEAAVHNLLSVLQYYTVNILIPEILAELSVPLPWLILAKPPTNAVTEQFLVLFMGKMYLKFTIMQESLHTML